MGVGMKLLHIAEAIASLKTAMTDGQCHCTGPESHARCPGVPLYG